MSRWSQLVPGPSRTRRRARRGSRGSASRDRRVDRIHPQREVGRQHDRRVPLRRIVRVGHRVRRRGIRRHPLLRAGRALRQLPLVLEQVVEEPVVPLGRVVGPRAFEPAGDRVGALAGADRVVPAEALRLDGAALGLGADVGRRSPAPWDLPNVWPPTMSATVSSSFIAMRANVSRMSLAAAIALGLPFGPSGFT